MSKFRQVRVEFFEEFDNAPTLELRLFDDDRLSNTRRVSTTEIDRLIDEVEKTYSRQALAPRTFGHQALAALGETLFQFLDGDERWLAKYTSAPGTVMRIDASQRFRHLPWELVFDGSFKTVNVAAPLAPIRIDRDITVRHGDAVVHNRPLRVLFMAASPEGAVELAYEVEEAGILQAAKTSHIELVVEESGSLQGLQERIDFYGADYFDVLHLSGHATVTNNSPTFLLEDEIGDAAPTSPIELQRGLRGRWPRLVFVSGCLTGNAPDQGQLPSMAESLVAAGAEHVLGWGLPVGDQAASEFAAALYQTLAAGHPVGFAVSTAREELHHNQSPFWHYLRHYSTTTSPLGPMVTPPGKPDRKRLPTQTVTEEFLDPDTQKIRVAAREDYVGRRRPLQNCLRALRSSDYQGVVVQGMGGLGKSTLASRLLERMPRHRRVVYYKRVDETRFINQLSQLTDDPSEIENMLTSETGDLETKLRKLLKGPLDTTPVLFVFDDFEANLEPRNDTHICRPGVVELLGSLLRAIKTTGSGSRVILTSRYEFPALAGANLYLEKLTTLSVNDETKKVNQLQALKPSSTTDTQIRTRALKAAGGNPRLLEWMDKVVADPNTDANELIAAIGNETDRFLHENIFAQKLLAMQRPEVRSMLAQLNVIELPIPHAAIDALHQHPESDTHIDRASQVGLLETGRTTNQGDTQYFVSNMLRPLLSPLLDEQQTKQACAKAARILNTIWLNNTNPDN